MIPHVLYIEDNIADMALVKNILSPYYIVHAYTTPDKDDPARYRCILCDLNLDDTFGIETLDRVKTCYPDTPIIVLTGTAGAYLTGDVIVSLMQSGADNVASKDILCDDSLISLIERTIK